MIENRCGEVHPETHPISPSRVPTLPWVHLEPWTQLQRRRRACLVAHNLEMDGSPRDLASGPPTSPRRTLGRGILLFRWVTLAWMTATAMVGLGELERPVVAWGSIA